MINLNQNLALSFDDVLLVPKLGVLKKRKDANISSKLFYDVTLKVPIISAPMSSVTHGAMAEAMAFSGGFGFIDRFLSIKDQVTEFHNSKGLGGCAIGINEGYERLKALFDAGCDKFCLDVAHAHHESVYNFMNNLPFLGFYIMVGNIATREAAKFLQDFPFIHSVKVGIGPGAACQTREVTGFGAPQFSAIAEVAEVFENSIITVVADGGIRNSGDIVKALAAGADTVMVGKLLAGANESPFPGEYFGQASKRVNGHHAPEGVEGIVELSDGVVNTIKRLSWGIKSGLSYAGVTNLEELRTEAEFRLVSPLSLSETRTRL